MKHKDMKEEHKIFSNEYLKDFNGTRAYRAAYGDEMSENTAAASASRLLRKDNIQTYLKERVEDRMDRLELAQDDVVQELANIAFSDPTDIINIVTKIYTDKHGEEREVVELTYKETESLPANVKATIKSIKPNNRGMIEVEFHDKMRALEMLGRHFGMFDDRLTVEATQEDKVADMLEGIANAVNQ